MAKIYCIANQKGGVGKTTTAMNLGCGLAQKNKRVLLVDSDPQANLTNYLGVNPENTLDELYLYKKEITKSYLKSFIHPTKSGVSLIAGDSGLSGVDYYLFSRQNREMILSKILQKVADDFDYILIDTPPSLGLLTINALVASRGILIPVQPEFFSLEGIVKIREAIADIRKQFNPKLEIRGILVTQANVRRRLTTEVIKSLEAEFEDKVFRAMIHENSAVSESSGHARSVIEYAPKSRGADDYRFFTEEFLKTEVRK